MGYATLDTALSFSSDDEYDNIKNIPPSGSSILIKDTIGAEGGFLIHHFLVNQLKAEKHAVLVSLAQTMQHYATIGRKLGINLQIAQQKGTFSYIDGLTHLYTTAPSSSNDSTINPPSTISTNLRQQSLISDAFLTNCDSSSSLSSPSLSHIYSTIKSVITTRHNIPGSRLALIIDDLSALLYAGCNVCNLIEFFKACRLLCQKQKGSLITLIHADEAMDAIISSADEENARQEDLFIKSLQYQSEYILAVRGLGSGFSRDVSGEITLARGPQNYDLEYRPTTLQYKILDNNVQFFARGFSQGVL
ncbi:9609_t:CDS:2 [Ambispora gerdemannii]|uniref:9609_t:CDS:1 n=1 Tax=Ambispora gerdemannii TaxID=144530 RepID=A0A9N8V229_9GLOM|nr:9609_t:CDS:2 [Ambispora gerdemannii]